MLEPLTGFQFLRTHHCVTGSLQHIYVFHGHPLSEELLLGIGGGVGFVYWHSKGTLPFLGGRANVRGGFEAQIGQRTGVEIRSFSTSSARRAEEQLLALLEAGEPVMLQVDMGFLPYFDFGGAEYHFGGHCIVTCGLDRESRQVLVADRDGIPYPVSLDALARARGSTFKPFPPHHAWCTCDFTARRMPTAEEMRAAIREQVAGMLQPPIANLGVAGVRKAAGQIVRWGRSMTEAELREAAFNVYIMIDAAGGTGGGLFRYMFGRFLNEAAVITGIEALAAAAGDFQVLGDRWQEVAAVCHEAAEAGDPADVLTRTVPPLLLLADMEAAAWQRLRDLVTA